MAMEWIYHLGNNFSYLVYASKKRPSDRNEMAGMGMGAPVAEALIEGVDIPEHAVGLGE